jgi:hypothetical protein
MRNLPFIVLLALGLASTGASAQSTAPVGTYRAGTVPTVAPDATLDNVGTPATAASSPATPDGVPDRPAVGGFGPVTTDNGVAAAPARAASAASSPRITVNTARRARSAQQAGSSNVVR